MTSALAIGFLIYPDMTQLDATGPAQILSRLPGARMHYVWKSLDPVPNDAGFSILPTDNFENCPPLDVICVPGGAGCEALMNDVTTLSFLTRQAATARYVTSVCTGSLILGAAGLLKGRRSACHWAWRDLLSEFGAIPDSGRVVQDGNYFSGGGVTAGIDFALVLAAELAGEETARMLELAFEYDPAPPFGCGTPDKAGPERTARMLGNLAKVMERRLASAAQAKARLAPAG